jgi:hypothetical protein
MHGGCRAGFGGRSRRRLPVRLTEVIGGAGAAADPDGPLRRRGVHPAHAGSRLRRSRRGDQLGPHRGCARGAAVAAQVDLSGASDGRAQEGCQVLPSSSGATRSPTPSPRRSPGRCTSATTSRRRCGCCGAVRWPPWSPATKTPLFDYDNDDRAPLLVHLRRRGPPHAPQRPALQRQHYKSNTVTEVEEYPGYAHLGPPRTVGSRLPTTPWPGPRSTRGDRGAPNPDHPDRRVERIGH